MNTCSHCAHCWPSKGSAACRCGLHPDRPRLDQDTPACKEFADIDTVFDPDFYEKAFAGEYDWIDPDWEPGPIPEERFQALLDLLSLPG